MNQKHLLLLIFMVKKLCFLNFVIYVKNNVDAVYIVSIIIRLLNKQINRNMKTLVCIWLVTNCIFLSVG